MRRWLIIAGAVLGCAFSQGQAPEARVLRIRAGTDGIGRAALSAASGDTLMLTTGGGLYHETDRVALPAVPLTIMADPAASDLPVWTTEGSRHLRVYHDLVVKGIRFDGQDRAEYAIRSYAPQPNRIMVEGCEFAFLLRDGITDNDVPVDTCIVRNTVFHDIGETGIEFRTDDMCRNLFVENCTFYRMGGQALRIARRAAPVMVRITNITAHDCNSAIFLVGVEDAVISNSIITGCRTYAIRSDYPVTVTHICTFGNRKDYDDHPWGEGCFEADPLYFDPDAGDFSLLPDSPALTAVAGGVPVGDLRWVGAATVRAGRRRFLSTWGRAAGVFLFASGSLGGLFFFIRRREERKREAAIRRAVELEGRVLERTAELRDTNEQLRKEIAERRRVEADLRAKEEQLRQSQKLEAIGRLAGGVAHDFNNQLAVIRGYVDMALEGLEPGSRLHTHLSQIQRAVSHSANLTEQMLMFSSKQPVHMQPTDLNRNVRDLQMMLERLLGEDISFDLDLEGNPWAVNADSGNMDQVITNLAVNARDAMPNGGTLTIQTRNVVVDEAYCRRFPDARPGRSFRLTVQDTGVGMTEEVKEKLFEPFFTTKGPGKGTGLGLSVVYGILQVHKGWITVESEPGRGSSFSIYLPVVDEAVEFPEETGPEVVAGRFQGSGERILLVEDEPALREMTAQALLDKGYRVHACGTVAEAVDAFFEATEPFDLVLSDVVLPDRRGTDLVFDLLKERPDLAAILMTGYTDERADWDRTREAGLTLLQKPVAMASLLEKVQEALKDR